MFWEARRRARGRVLGLLFSFVFISMGCGGDSGPFGITPPPGQAEEQYFREPSGVVLETQAYGEVDPTSLLLMVDPSAGLAAAEAAARAAGGRLVGGVPEWGHYQIEIAAESEAELAAALAAVSAVDGVVAAGPDQLVELEESGRRCSPIDGPEYAEGDRANQFELIGLEEASWMIAGSGRPVSSPVVAVVDDFTQGWHGRDVVNLIGGEHGVATGALGVEFVALEYDREDPMSDVENALTNALKHDPPPAVINMSFGWTPPSDYTVRYLQKLVHDHPDVLFVASAGNTNIALDGRNHAPGGMSAGNLITVTGLTPDAEKAWFSNHLGEGGDVTFAAQADGVFPARYDSAGNPVSKEGTSFAAAQTTGAAAVLEALDPTLTAAEIKQILVDTAAAEVADPDINERITAIPASLGGKVLRLDNAVEHVLVRRLGVAGSREELIARGVIDLSATEIADLQYQVIATVEAAGPGGTEVVLDWVGDGVINGPLTQTLSSAGSVTWTHTFLTPEDQVNLVVTRTDTGACARLHLGTGPPVESPCGDPRLDGLYAACAAGDMAACDALYRESPQDSACETFGKTCGGTTDGSAMCAAEAPCFDARLNGFYWACLGGDLAACDDLYRESPEDSACAEFGRSCGETRTGGTGWCIDDGPCFDPRLNGLYQACVDGDMAACDNLYRESPMGSACERFGTTCGQRTTQAGWCVDLVPDTTQETTGTTLAYTTEPGECPDNPDCFPCGGFAQGGVVVGGIPCSHSDACPGVWDEISQQYVACLVSQGEPPRCYCPWEYYPTP